jgi:putative transposase
LFRTLKYRPGYPDGPFVSLVAAQAWVDAFVRWYNEDHHSGIRFVTPAQRHAGRDVAILENRKRVCAAARARVPHRWTRATRDWSRIEVVRLNPRSACSPVAAPAEPADQRAPNGAQAG